MHFRPQFHFGQMVYFNINIFMFRTVPRYIRWILSITLLSLVTMTIARIALLLVFNTRHYDFYQYLSPIWLGIRYDLREVGIVGVIILLLGAIRPLNPFITTGGKRFFLITLYIYYFLLFSMYALDFAYFDYLHQRLNANMLNFLQDARVSFGMVVQAYPFIKITLSVIVVTWLLMLFIRKRYTAIDRQKDDNVTTRSKWFWGILVFLLLGGGVYGSVGQYPLRWSDAFSIGDEFLSQMALNPVQSFFSSLKFRYSSFDKNKVVSAYPTMSSYLGVANPDSTTLTFERAVAATDTARTAPNVVLVICESFSAYKSSMWGNPLNTTPYFNALCQQGIFFDHCFTPHFGTARGVWATITGIPDVQLDKTASRNPATVNQHSIINDLEGYEKYYFIGGSTSWANMRALLENNIHGLHLYEQDKYDAPKVDVWGISDKNLFLQANKVLKQQQKPFFAVIQTSDNHRPYTIPQEDRGAFKAVHFSDDSLNRYGFQRNEELNAFRYTDFCFEKFIEAAKKEKYFKNTVFIFIGDHGIRGDAASMFPRAWTNNGLTCFHVPLLFYAPGMLTPVRHTMNCSQVDVLPTIAGITGKAYHNTTLGRDLLRINDSSSNAAFIIDHDEQKIGVIHGDYYYTRLLTSGKETLVSIKNNEQVGHSTSIDSLQAKLAQLTNAFYETSRYMLLNNKKK